MSFGYDHDNRRRRQAWGVIVKIGFYLSTLGVVGIFAYQTGVEQIEERENRLRARIDTLESENVTLTDSALTLDAQARQAEMRYAELEQAYMRDVPTGPRRQLLELITERLEEGLAPERLAFFISAADEPEGCTEAETRRFILPTAVYDGPNTSVGFAEGRITVTGFGQNAQSESGQDLSWFDPAQPVEISFTQIGGDEERVSGLLPLHHSFAMERMEYRFTVRAGEEQSLVYVTADACPLLPDAIGGGD
jgi:hypothetical protein